ncbi:MAG: hypothetical protein ACFCD0_04180 [Gemmataceae bacterium]
MDALRHFGHRSDVSINRCSRDRINVIVGHTVFLQPEHYAAFQFFGAPYVVVQVEALAETVGFASQNPAYIEFLTGARQIWDYSPTNLPVLVQWGCREAHYVPVGYVSSLERVAQGVDKDIDILFYGASSPRREQVLTTLCSLGVRVSVLFGVYGAARDRAIARAKIVLNIHQFETPHLEELRLAYLLNNRSFVISEVSDRDPYDGGVVFCEYNELVDCCISFLHPEAATERDRIAAKGYEALRRISTVESIGAALTKLGIGDAFEE